MCTATRLAETAETLALCDGNIPSCDRAAFIRRRAARALLDALIILTDEPQDYEESSREVDVYRAMRKALGRTDSEEIARDYETAEAHAAGLAMQYRAMVEDEYNWLGRRA